MVMQNEVHTKFAVYSFMQYIFTYLKKQHPQIIKIDVFSDGAALQFKQKYLFSNLHEWEEAHGIKLRWNFFATSHGKGAVDGLGGTVKRLVWRAVCSGTVAVTTAEEYSKIAADRNPAVHVAFIPKTDVAELQTRLAEKWSSVLAIPRTQRLHCFKPVNHQQIEVAEFSTSDFRIHNIRRLENTSIPSEWSVVGSEDTRCPGEVLRIVLRRLHFN
jgi:hypothetical protein